MILGHPLEVILSRVDMRPYLFSSPVRLFMSSAYLPCMKSFVFSAIDHCLVAFDILEVASFGDCGFEGGVLIDISLGVGT